MLRGMEKCSDEILEDGDRNESNQQMVKLFS